MCKRHIHLKILNDYQIKPHYMKCSLPTCSWLKKWHCMVFTVRCSFHISLVMTLLKLNKALPIRLSNRFNCHVIEMKRRYCKFILFKLYVCFIYFFHMFFCLNKHITLEWFFINCVFYLIPYISSKCWAWR